MQRVPAGFLPLLCVSWKLGLAAFLFDRAMTAPLVTLLTMSVLSKGPSLFCVLTTV